MEYLCSSQIHLVSVLRTSGCGWSQDLGCDFSRSLQFAIDIVVIDRKRWQQTEKSELMWLMTSKIPSLLSGGFYRMLNLWQWFLCPQITITHLRPSAQPDSTHQSSLIFCQRFRYWESVCRRACVCVCARSLRMSTLTCVFLSKMERAQSIKHLTIEDLPL